MYPLLFFWIIRFTHNCSSSMINYNSYLYPAIQYNYTCIWIIWFCFMNKLSVTRANGSATGEHFNLMEVLTKLSFTCWSHQLYKPRGSKFYSSPRHPRYFQSPNQLPGRRKLFLCSNKIKQNHQCHSLAIPFIWYM